MRRWPIAIFGVIAALILGAASVRSQDKAAPISIEYHGQSFYIITTSKGTRVAIDPHTIPNYPRPEEWHKADIVCITHNHNDHTRIEAFGDNIKKAP